MTVRDKENQQQNVDDLSRNTEDANNPLAHIFDKQKEQDKIEQQQQLINDIAAQMKDVANKYDRIQAQNEVDKHPELVDKAAKEAYDKLSAEEKAKTSLADFTAANKDSLYYTAVDTQVKNSKENIGGIGSSVNKGIDAATSVITGILTGNIVGGLAGAGAPYIAEQIKLHTGHQESDGSWKMDDPNANLIAHAILGGVVAQLQGNSALAGATGAAGSEKIADIIREQLYDNRPVKDLTESEKQNISNLTQLALGLATALATGSDMGDTGTAVNAGKNAVENNALTTKKDLQDRDKAIVDCNGNNQCIQDINKKAVEEAIRRDNEVNDCNTAASCLALYKKYVEKLEEEGTTSDYHNEKAEETGSVSDKFAAIMSNDTYRTSLLILANKVSYLDDATPEMIAEVNDYKTKMLAAMGVSVASGIGANKIGSTGKGSPIPVKDPVTASNGLNYQSNPKHTINPPSNAGIEPKNSLNLFENSVSVSVKNQKARYTMDSNGNIHQFMPDNTGNWHWAGSTADKLNPLILPNDVKSALKKQEGWKIK